jgi:hypothetical protein
LYQYPSIDQIELRAKFAAVDAELAIICQRKRNLSYRRSEQIPGSLVIYSMCDISGWTNYGDCGQIVLQFLDDGKTCLSVKVTPPNKSDAALFAPRGSGWGQFLTNSEREKYLNDSELSLGYITLFNHRLEFLNSICITVSTMVSEQLQPDANNKLEQKNTSSRKRRTHGHSVGERIDRIALLLLEKKIKEENFYISHKSAVARIQTIFEFPIEEYTIRNARKYFLEAQSDYDEQTLSQAEKKAEEWFQRLK